MSRAFDAAQAAFVFVGQIVPDDPEFFGPAFNRAAQMFQDELVKAMRTGGLPITAAYSIEPRISLPRGDRLFVGTRRVKTRTGLHVRLLPYINVHPLKSITAGLSVTAALVRWGWRNRGRKRVVHCVNLTMPPGIFILVAARLIGAKAVVSVLDVWKPGALVPDTWWWRFDYWMQRRLIPRFDGLMVVSQAIVDDFAPGRRVCRLEGGVAPERFGPPPVFAERREGSPFRIVLSGSLEPYNGVVAALDAMTHLSDRYELVVAGVGSLASLVEARAQKDPRITYRGFLDFAEVLEIYRSADLLLNMRLTRAMDTRYFFPSKLMELLASGTPVLSTCTGQVEEEYGDVLFLLRDETADGLAARIREVADLSYEARYDKGLQAREFVFAEKTWARQGERLARYIQREVLAAK